MVLDQGKTIPQSVLDQAPFTPSQPRSTTGRRDVAVGMVSEAEVQDLVGALTKLGDVHRAEEAVE